MNEEIYTEALNRANVRKEAKRKAEFNMDKLAAIAEVSGLSQEEIFEIAENVQIAQRQKHRKTLFSFAIIALIVGILIGLWFSSYGRVQAKLTNKMPPPQLWSDIREINLTPEVCVTKSKTVLKAMSTKSIAVNGQYLYGVLDLNRLVIKCVPAGNKTVLFVGVAGPGKNSVEELRNKLVWAITND